MIKNFKELIKYLINSYFTFKSHLFKSLNKVHKYSYDEQMTLKSKMDNKKCFKCDNVKPVSQFGKNKAKKDGLQTQCKLCRKITNNQHYANSENRRNRVRENRKKYYYKASKLINRYKSFYGCKLCNEKEPCVIDLHHLDHNTKEYSVSEMVGRFNYEKVKIEIRKCVPLCANCHRKVHKGILSL